MVFVNYSMNGMRIVKVLVVPIGENSLFDSHFDLISNMKCFPKQFLGSESSLMELNGSFKNFSWKDGDMMLDYVRYDVTKRDVTFEEYIDVSDIVRCKIN